MRCVVCNHEVLMTFQGGECVKCQEKRIPTGLSLADVLAIEPQKRIVTFIAARNATQK